MFSDSDDDALIEQLREKLRDLQRDYRHEQRRVRDLQGQIQELRLTALAAYELLVERASVSPGELEAKIVEIDHRDGDVDGRQRLPYEPRRCPRCNRVYIKSADFCLYCGSPGEQL